MCPPVAAAPTDLVVGPHLAPAGQPVQVSGQGCVGAVEVKVHGYTVGVGVDEIHSATITPGADGSWADTFAMPDQAAHVQADCDGGTAMPVAIGATDGELGGMSIASMDDDEVVISTWPMLEDSLFEILALDGTQIDATTVVDGEGTVRVPRALAPATLVLLSVIDQPNGIPLPWLGQASTVQLPQWHTPTVTADPRVSPAGTAVSASGACDGAARVQVLGQVDGWYDDPPVHLDRRVPVTSGRWTTTFPMPVDASTVIVTCTVGSSVETATTVIAPSDGTPSAAAASATPAPDGSGWLLEAPACGLSASSPQLFTASGAAVPALPGPEPWQVEIDDESPGPVFVLGIEALGENASAQQNERPQVCLAALPGGTVAPDPDPAVGAGAGRPSDRSAEALLGRAAELPATGGVPLLLPAVVLVLTGALLVITSRRPRSRPLVVPGRGRD